MTEFFSSFGEWLPLVSAAIAILGAAVSVWSFMRTRKRYYDEFMERRNGDS